MGEQKIVSLTLSSGQLSKTHTMSEEIDKLRLLLELFSVCISSHEVKISYPETSKDFFLFG